MVHSAVQNPFNSFSVLFDLFYDLTLYSNYYLIIMNIALYGGAFDPPHIGHLRTLQSLCKVQGIDEIWLVPCGERQDKKLLLSTKIRFQLMKNLSQENSRVKVSQHGIEMSRLYGAQVLTYDLLNELKKKHEGVIFHFVIGADVLQSIHSWGNAEKLVSENNFIVFNRKGYELDKNKLPKKLTGDRTRVN